MPQEQVSADTPHARSCVCPTMASAARGQPSGCVYWLQGFEDLSKLCALQLGFLYQMLAKCASGTLTCLRPWKACSHAQAVANAAQPSPQRAG